jgi:excisionase family DNA binding protein
MHIHPNTVRRWTDQGKLNTQQRIGPRGARRFSEEEINNFRDVDLTSSQAAKKMYVHVNTVIRWADQGRLSTQRIGSRGDRRFNSKEIEDFMSTDPHYSPEP